MIGKQKNYKSIEPCIACGVRGDGICCYHHELSRGHDITQKDNPLVKFTLCQTHHTMRHSIGQSAFIKKFPQYAAALEEKGWIYCELKRVWKFPEG
jgi:hypothetical protein